MLLCGLGSGGRTRRDAPSTPAPDVSRHAVAVVEDLHRGGREAHLHLLSDEAVRNAVEVVLDGDVVVDADSGLAPLGVLVARAGKRLQSGPLHALEQRATSSLELLEGAIVQ